jgi:hypothetical protein
VKSASETVGGCLGHFYIHFYGINVRYKKKTLLGVPDNQKKAIGMPQKVFTRIWHTDKNSIKIFC